MRVCMIVPRYPPDRCGVGDYTRLLAQHLAERGVSVTVLTSRTLAPYHVAHPGTRGSRGEGVRVLPLIEEWGWRSLLRLCAVATAGRYDLVHVQYQNEMYHRSAAITALPLALRFVRPGLPVVVTVHDYGTPWPRRLRMRAIAGPYGKAWFAAMLLACARVILTNEQDEWRFLHQPLRYPVPASRYVTIPIGSNLPTVPVPASPPAGDEIMVGYFGFVNPAKGVDTLLDGFGLAYRRCPSLRLTMLCALDASEPYQGEILRKIVTLGLQDVVTVTGELDDARAAAMLAGCAMVVLPFRDGISLRRTTLMAALALGRPTISTRAAVLPAALREGRDVVLVPAGDAVALAGAIVDLAGDPARRAVLGTRAREAAQAFAWPTIAARTESLYRQLLV